MHTKRLFLEDMDDWALQELLRAVEYSHDASVEGWLQQISDGTLAVFALDRKGLLGLTRWTNRLHVEFLVGRGLEPHTPEILDFVVEQARGLPVEAFVTREGLVKYYKGLGFKSTGTWMRYEHGRR